MMEGRRINRRAKKYNPLFILFLCLVAAVAVLLILSIVLGARLGKTNKKLKAAEAEVKELKVSVEQLESDLELARSRASRSDTAAPGGTTVPSQTAGESSGTSSGSSTQSSGNDVISWLDLTGHSEVKVKPSAVSDGYSTYYTTAGVNLRSGPATSYDRITTVEFGTKVQVAAREGNWSFAKVDSKFGWLSSDYLSTSQPAPQASSTSTKSSSSGSSSGSKSEATSGSLKR